MWSGTTSEGRVTIPSGKSGKSRTVAATRKSVGMRDSTTAVVWMRRDLRVQDHPSLSAAARAHDRVVPLFVLDDALLGGRFPSPSRAAFLFGCLRELHGALRERGGALVVREGDPRREVPALAREVRADTVYWARDVSPYARARDRAVTRALEASGVQACEL